MGTNVKRSPRTWQIVQPNQPAGRPTVRVYYLCACVRVFVRICNSLMRTRRLSRFSETPTSRRIDDRHGIVVNSRVANKFDQLESYAVLQFDLPVQSFGYPYSRRVHLCGLGIHALPITGIRENDVFHESVI